MKLTAVGGTDGATMVLFWPAHLPEDADQQLNDDPVALFDKLATEGKFIQFPCDGDGEYGLAVYLDEPIPDHVQAKCKRDRTFQPLIAKGDAYFDGGEYVFKQERLYLDKYPHKSERIQIPDGVYQATVYLSEDTSGTSAQWLRQQLSPADRAVKNLQIGLFLLFLLSFLAGVVSFFAFSWPIVGAIWATAAFLVLVIYLLSRTSAIRRVQEVERERDREFPAYLLHLTPLS